MGNFEEMSPALHLPLICALLQFWILSCLRAAEPVPDRLVALTFDDSVRSQYTVVRPLLKRLGFGATFFISEGFSFPTNKQDYMTWEQIAELHKDGFEIGNHTRDHLAVSSRTLGQLREQIEAINQRCAEHGITRPVSFGYPGNGIQVEALPILANLGFKFARRGGAPEHPYEWGRGFAYDPAKDHPLLLPSAGDARPDWTLSDFKRAVDQAKEGHIAILQFHGVPDRDHPWVNTPPERFTEYMHYLETNRFKVVALRDLARYVNLAQSPADPLAVVKERQAARSEILVQGEIIDADTGKPLPARIYIQGADGSWHFPKSASGTGSAIRYEKRNGKSVEMHTTLSSQPFRVELTPGRYTFKVEYGKEFFPESQEIEVRREMPHISLKLRRWSDIAKQGWFSGDGHNHRSPTDLDNVMLAEDLNVALPMVDWTTEAEIPPLTSGRGFPGDFEARPMVIDSTHAWFPRNTEYEIFRTSRTNHTLGALLILNHRTRFAHPVLPLETVISQARSEGALLDLEKHNWPWSIALAAIAPVDLFELGNNHHWQADYVVRNWAVPAPKWMELEGTGTDTLSGWTLYGFKTYYTLLNAGFNIRPSAGTANGVHPVPLGFSRVYVHLDGSFSYEKWIKGLGEGRSFVTTGPMLLTTVNQTTAGTNHLRGEASHALECRITSEQPLEKIELIRNGKIFKSFPPLNARLKSGAYETILQQDFKTDSSCWLAWRCFEPRGSAPFRFAHSAPCFFDVADKPLVCEKAEAEWLVSRVREEIARSQDIVPESLIREYKRALSVYEEIATRVR